jgi:hypothetical protein
MSALPSKADIVKQSRHVRFVPKADHTRRFHPFEITVICAIGTTLIDDSRCGRFLFDRFCDPQHRNLPINLAIAEMGDGHGRETPPRKSDVVLSISRWPLAQ